VRVREQRPSACPREGARGSGTGGGEGTSGGTRDKGVRTRGEMRRDWGGANVSFCPAPK